MVCRSPKHTIAFAKHIKYMYVKKASANVYYREV